MQDTDLMRFVFNNDPATVQKQLPELSDELSRTLGSYSALPLTLNIYETEFYSKGDGSLDFGRTRYVQFILQPLSMVWLLLYINMFQF